MKALNIGQPVPRCNHISAKRNVCYRPVARGRNLCHVHLALEPKDDDLNANLELPAIKDLASIRAGESKVLTALSVGDITRRRASLYLYAFQLARQSARQLERAKKRETEKRAE